MQYALALLFLCGSFWALPSSDAKPIFDFLEIKSLMAIVDPESCKCSLAPEEPCPIAIRQAHLVGFTCESGLQFCCNRRKPGTRLRFPQNMPSSISELQKIIPKGGFKPQEKLLEVAEKRVEKTQQQKFQEDQVVEDQVEEDQVVEDKVSEDQVGEDQNTKNNHSLKPFNVLHPKEGEKMTEKKEEVEDFHPEDLEYGDQVASVEHAGKTSKSSERLCKCTLTRSCEPEKMDFAFGASCDLGYVKCCEMSEEEEKKQKETPPSKVDLPITVILPEEQEKKEATKPENIDLSLSAGKKNLSTLAENNFLRRRSGGIVEPIPNKQILNRPLPGSQEAYLHQMSLLAHRQQEAQREAYMRSQGEGVLAQIGGAWQEFAAGVASYLPKWQ